MNDNCFDTLFKHEIECHHPCQKFKGVRSLGFLWPSCFWGGFLGNQFTLIGVGLT